MSMMLLKKSKFYFEKMTDEETGKEYDQLAWEVEHES